MVVMRKINRIEIVADKDRALYESKGYTVVKQTRRKQESGNGATSQAAGASAGNQNANTPPAPDEKKPESGNGGDNAKKNLEKDLEQILN